MAPRCVLSACLCVAALVALGCRQAATPTEAEKVTLVAVGDVFFARGVAKQVEKHTPDYVFEKTRKILRGADIAFCNLECPLSVRGVPQRTRYLFRCDPTYARVLSENGFDVACLANNHTLDYGRDALMDTIQAVQKAGMVALGAGRDRKDALKLRVVKRNGLRIGFIGYTDLPTRGVVRLDDKPTVAGVNCDELEDQVRRAKSRCDALVVSFHWGVEYMKRPTERQVMLAHACIDGGADVVLGHHPHVLQTTEVYRNKPIVYSMGAFVWDAKVFGADKSAVYRFELGKSSARLLGPVPIDIINCRPAPGG